MIETLHISTNAKPFESLGYSQALAFVEGRISKDEAIASAQMETRRYAKRQMTWFRRDQNIRWFAEFGHQVSVQDDVVDYLRVQLSQ